MMQKMIPILTGHDLYSSDAECVEECATCIQGKLIKPPSRWKLPTKMLATLYRIHSDWWGPITSQSGQFKYFFVLVDVSLFLLVLISPGIGRASSISCATSAARRISAYTSARIDASSDIIGYVDSGFKTDPVSGKSQTGYIFIQKMMHRSHDVPPSRLWQLRPQIMLNYSYSTRPPVKPFGYALCNRPSFKWAVFHWWTNPRSYLKTTRSALSKFPPDSSKLIMSNTSVLTSSAILKTSHRSSRSRSRRLHQQTTSSTSSPRHYQPLSTAN